MGSDTSRHRLHTRLEEVLGPDPADTLMTHLPNVRWEDLATKQDLAQLRDELVERMDVGFAMVRTEMTTMRSDLRADMLEAIHSAVTSQTRTLVLSWAIALATVVAVLLTARLG